MLVTPAGIVIIESCAVPKFATHAPLASHVPFEHAVPAGAFAPATQTGPPDAQSMVPVRHCADGVHEAPAMQATHRPLPLHTPPGQAVPAL
jgi:hypothetical protein